MPWMHRIFSKKNGVQYMAESWLLPCHVPVAVLVLQNRYTKLPQTLASFGALEAQHGFIHYHTMTAAVAALVVLTPAWQYNCTSTQSVFWHKI